MIYRVESPGVMERGGEQGKTKWENHGCLTWMRSPVPLDMPGLYHQDIKANQCLWARDSKVLRAQRNVPEEKLATLCKRCLSRSECCLGRNNVRCRRPQGVCSAVTESNEHEHLYTR